MAELQVSEKRAAYLRELLDAAVGELSPDGGGGGADEADMEAAGADTQPSAGADAAANDAADDAADDDAADADDDAADDALRDAKAVPSSDIRSSFEAIARGLIERERERNAEP